MVDSFYRNASRYGVLLWSCRSFFNTFQLLGTNVCFFFLTSQTTAFISSLNIAFTNFFLHFSRFVLGAVDIVTSARLPSANSLSLAGVIDDAATSAYVPPPSQTGSTWSSPCVFSPIRASRLSFQELFYHH